MSVNIFYKKLIIILFYLFLLSCSNEEQQRKKITIGVTFKINNLSSNSYENNLVYQWWVGNHPKNSDYTLEPLNKKALFTPDVVGKYDVFVSIRDSNDLEIELIEFYYTVVLEKIKNIISDKALNQFKINANDSLIIVDSSKINLKSDPLITQPINKATTKIILTKTKYIKQNIGWTIQLSSRASLELAKKDQLKAIENGYDAYIEQTIIKETNKTWYRVRLGNFKNKSTTRTIQSEIKSFWKSDTWIDRVKVK